MGPDVQRHNNAGLYPLFRDINIIARIKQRRIRWVGHVQCMGGRKEQSRHYSKKLEEGEEGMYNRENGG